MDRGFFHTGHAPGTRSTASAPALGVLYTERDVCAMTPVDAKARLIKHSRYDSYESKQALQLMIQKANDSAGWVGVCVCVHVCARTCV